MTGAGDTFVDWGWGCDGWGWLRWPALGLGLRSLAIAGASFVG